MKGKNNILILLLVLFIGAMPVVAQKKSDKLKEQERELKKKNKELNELLSEKKNKQRLTLIELAIVNEQLEVQEELIGNMTNQVRRLNQEIAENNSVIESLKTDMVKMKKQYGKMLMYAYKHRNKNHVLLYIFSSKNFNQAFSRMKYIKQFSEYKVEKLKMIRDAQKTLEKKLEQLKDKKAEKEGLVQKQTEEKEIFHKNKEQQQIALKEMKKQETEITKELKKVLQQQTALQDKINKAIDQEEYDDYIEKGDKEFKKENYDKAISYYKKALGIFSNDKSAKSKLEEAKELKKKKEEKKDPKDPKNPKTPEKDPVDPDDTPEPASIESTNFENNKGKLPWPVEKGSITQYFGKNAHPTVAGIFTNNNGVEISSTSGAKVRAVFDGKVSKVLVIDGGGKAVIINHGVYRTVYANMKEVTVKEGDKVSIKQNIGTLNTGEDNLSELHFEVRFGKERQNPYEWLMKK